MFTDSDSSENEDEIIPSEVYEQWNNNNEVYVIGVFVGLSLQIT